MGVHDLWSIVEPVRESVPLFGLSGKTLAVDLSLWVCEAQHVQAMMGRVTKPHLRVSSLTRMGVKLVFVMEGEAPKVKAETMSKRTETRYGGFKKAAVPTNTSRGRFKALLRECADMLDSLGVPWVTAAGEAEAMCACLDARGLVDGCITNDGDAFLYGAQTVYRNFNMNSKDPQVDCYRTSRVRTELRLSRENLVGLAILLGCDYIPKGVPGVGKEQALRLIQMLGGQTLLQRFKQWREGNTGVSEGVEKKVAHCHVCRHPGSAKAHERGGCVLCDSRRFCQPRDFDQRCPCDWHRHQETRHAAALEATIRRKTLASPRFPFTEIIAEFLISKDEPRSHFQRRRPNMLSLQRFAFDKMEWPTHYTSGKVLVLMTYAELMNRTCGGDASSQIQPLRIVKPRVRNAVACFEVAWSTPEHYVFPDDHPAERQREVRTLEEELLFREAYPQLVESYLRDKARAEESKKKRKPKSRAEEPSDPAPGGISDLLARLSLRGSPDAEPRTLLPSVSNTADPEAAAAVVVLDSPVNTPLQSRAQSEASPSASAAIEALHLSDVDWDSLSFTSSPNHEPKSGKTTEGEGRGTGDGEQEASDVPEADCGLGERPLRDRVLMRNTSADVVSEHLLLNGCGESRPSGRKENEALGDQRQRGTNAARREARRTNARPQGETRSKRDGSQQHGGLWSSSDPPQRLPSDPGPRDGRAPPLQTTKTSVCVILGSSSEESDADDRPFGPRRKNKNKSSFPPGVRRKPVPLSEPQRCGVDAALELGAETTPRDGGDADAFLRTPASPLALSDGDDSALCGGSPLPLAERLRLKMMK